MYCIWDTDPDPYRFCANLTFLSCKTTSHRQLCFGWSNLLIYRFVLLIDRTCWFTGSSFWLIEPVDLPGCPFGWSNLLIYRVVLLVGRTCWFTRPSFWLVEPVDLPGRPFGWSNLLIYRFVLLIRRTCWFTGCFSRWQLLRCNDDFLLRSASTHLYSAVCYEGKKGLPHTTVVRHSASSRRWRRRSLWKSSEKK